MNAAGTVPLWFKLLYSAFVAVLVPYYWATYTPWNFLYFCDVALLMTFLAIWTGQTLLISMAAVGMLLPQALWVVDFVLAAVAGFHITGMTGYMFDAEIPLFVRALSSFHGWLPFALAYLVWRVGYDRRAYAAQSVLAVGLLSLCYVVGPDPPASAEGQAWAGNINYVYGMEDGNPQTFMPAPLWLLLLMAANVIVFYVPTHYALRRFAPRPVDGRLR